MIRSIICTNTTTAIGPFSSTYQGRVYLERSASPQPHLLNILDFCQLIIADKYVILIQIAVTRIYPSPARSTCTCMLLEVSLAEPPSKGEIQVIQSYLIRRARISYLFVYRWYQVSTSVRARPGSFYTYLPPSSHEPLQTFHCTP